MKVCIVCDSEYGEDLEVCPQDGSSLMPSSRDAYIGQVIQDRYRIESLIAKGSMGAVYRATQLLINRDVAVKVLLHHLGNDDAALKRFQREAKAASKLNHKHITTLYDFGVMPDGQPYLVMDYLNGMTLADLLEQRKFLSADEFRPILQQVCEATGYAHKLGIVHRDIKPENIVLLEKDSQNTFVKVVDFGVAKLTSDRDHTESRLTKTGTICGSPAYLSPEQARSQPLDARSDIYSLGIVIFETLTGVLPFTAGDLINLLYLHATQPPPLINEVRADLRFSPELVRVVNRALAKDPSDRQQSMEDLWTEFDRACKAKGEAVSVSSGGSTGEIPSAATTQPPQPIQEVASYQQPEAAPYQPENAYQQQNEASYQQENAAAYQQPPVHNEQPVSEAALSQLLSSSRTPTSERSSGRMETLPRSYVSGGEQGSQFRTLTPYLVATGVVFLIGILIFSLLMSNHTPQWLLEHGRYEEALHALQVSQSSGKLNAEQFEQLNSAYVAVANKYAQNGRLPQAVALLNQVSPKSKKSGEAKRLIRKLKRKIRSSE
jgi:serine/threonine protein kinase